MRKFLAEYRDIITIDEVMRGYEECRDNGELYGATFAEYLDGCLGKNGALTEILTDETPRGQYAVSLYRVRYSDDPDDFCDGWMSPEQAKNKECYYGVTCEKLVV